MINNAEAVKVIDSKREDAVLVATMNANNVSFGLPNVTSNEKLDFPLSGSMGKASSLGLGLALAQPQRKVMVLDGDGSLEMNLGSLVTVANKGPKNLYHFVMDNGVYATTGGQDTPGANPASYTDLARAAGYAACYEFDELEDFASQAAEVMGQEGPVLICVKTVPNVQGPRDHSAPASTQVDPSTQITQKRPQAISNLLAEFRTG